MILLHPVKYINNIKVELYIANYGTLVLFLPLQCHIKPKKEHGRPFNKALKLVKIYWLGGQSANLRGAATSCCHRSCLACGRVLWGFWGQTAATQQKTNSHSPHGEAVAWLSLSFPTHQSVANVGAMESKNDILDEFRGNYHETFFPEPSRLKHWGLSEESFPLERTQFLLKKNYGSYNYIDHTSVVLTGGGI